jgi:hypothetical protein
MLVNAPASVSMLGTLADGSAAAPMIATDADDADDADDATGGDATDSLRVPAHAATARITIANPNRMSRRGVHAINQRSPLHQRAKGSFLRRPKCRKAAAKARQFVRTPSVDAEFAINRKDFGLVYAGKPDDLIREDVVIKLTIRSQKKS